MPNRMSRYNYNEKSRQEKNELLYKSTRTRNDYNDLSNVSPTNSVSEIDISKVRELVKGKEKYRNQSRTDYEYNEPVEEKNHDIKDILEEAKKSRTSTEKEEFLKDRHYDYLLNSKLYNKKAENLKQAENSVDEIIESISKTIQLNKVSNEDLSLELLNDLKGTTIIDNTPIRKLIEEEKQIEKQQELDKTNLEMDKSFYTSNILFKDKDFKENAVEAADKKEKINLILKIFLILVVVIILVLTILLVIKNF